MQKSIPAFNWSTTIFVVLIVQLIAISMLAASFMTLGATSVGSINQLPPINLIYASGDLLWVGAGRTIGHMVTLIMNLIIGSLCIWYGLSRKLKIIKFITVAMGIQFILTAAINGSIIGEITIGGWWHVVAAAAATLMAVSATATAVIFAMLHSHLRHLGVAHDSFISERTE